MNCDVIHSNISLLIPSVEFTLCFIHTRAKNVTEKHFGVLF